MIQFGGSRDEFSEPFRAFEEMWAMMTGGSLPTSGAVKSQFWSSDPALFIFALIFNFLVFMIMLNFIIAIIVEAYLSDKNEVAANVAEQGFFEYSSLPTITSSRTVSRIQLLFKNYPPPRGIPIPPSSPLMQTPLPTLLWVDFPTSLSCSLYPSRPLLGVALHFTQLVLHKEMSSGFNSVENAVHDHKNFETRILLIRTGADCKMGEVSFLSKVRSPVAVRQKKRI